jgi:hypothetical protein
LTGALIALVASALAVAAVGGVLLVKEPTEPSSATPPQGSTIGPGPTTVRPRTVRPTSVARSTAVPSTVLPETTHSTALGGYWIAFHEYGHHVQRRVGVLAAAYTRDEDQLQISRRIELQADCWMAMTGISIRTAGVNAADREEMRNWREVAGDRIHGKTGYQLFWIERGFGARNLGTCSTWRATKHIS